MEKAILATLSYADIFDFPLKAEEIWRWLIRDKSKPVSPARFAAPCVAAGARRAGGWPIVKSKFKGALGGLLKAKLCHAQGEFYFLPGREELVIIRKKRQIWSTQKFDLAQKIANLLKIVPTIKMVAVTGALAWENSEKGDDIDFFLVTQRQTLWLTRFMTTLFGELTGRRRHPQEKKVADKICLNMFVDEEHLMVPKNEQDLYTAHEVAQLKPLWAREQTYQKFLAVNLWVRKYLPNVFNKGLKTLGYKDLRVKKKNFPDALMPPCPYILGILEGLAKGFQLWYMKRHRTTEVIADGLIRFHPKDARVWVLREYQKRLAKNPLDKEKVFAIE